MLAGSLWDSQSPVILILSVFTGQTETLHIYTVLQALPRLRAGKWLQKTVKSLKSRNFRFLKF